MLKENYKKIRETYKYYAGVSLVNGVPAIGTNVLSEFITSINLADGKLVKLSDIDVEFIATNVSANY